MPLAACLLCAVLLVSPVAAQGGFTVDVWTNKGGNGQNASGGSFGVNDQIVVYVQASHDCLASITYAAAGKQAELAYQGPLQAGKPMTMTPTVAGTELLGSWILVVEAWTNTSFASDSVTFTVGNAVPAGVPPALTPDAATALDSLKALKMSQGAMAVDLSLDVDRDGKVTADDARLILTWAVQ